MQSGFPKNSVKEWDECQGRTGKVLELFKQGVDGVFICLFIYFLRIRMFSGGVVGRGKNTTQCYCRCCK